jgi:protein TonB
MSRLLLPILFLLLVAPVSAQTQTSITRTTDAKLINHLTSKAEFPGGYPELMKFLQKNIQYPQMERDNDIVGMVKVRFMVDTTGQVTNPEVTRHVSPGLDKEAMRVVKMLPKFKPAMYYKKPVPVYYLVEVNFRIQG